MQVDSKAGRQRQTPGHHPHDGHCQHLEVQMTFKIHSVYNASKVQVQLNSTGNAKQHQLNVRSDGSTTG